MTALPNPFTGTEVLAGEPINQDLMEKKYKENIEFLCVQIDAIGGGGGPGGSVSVSDGALADLQIGGETDEAVHVFKRFHGSQSSHPTSEMLSGFDPESKQLNSILIFPRNQAGGAQYVNNPNCYLGQHLELFDGKKVKFKVPKNANYFTIGVHERSVGAATVNVTIDGVAPTSIAGVENEQGGNPSDNFSTNTAGPNFYGTKITYYNLAKNVGQIVEIENADGAGKHLAIEFIEIGFRSNDPTISHTVKISEGKASVRGAAVEFDEGEITFPKCGEGRTHGYTGGIVSDGSGNLSALVGESTAQTTVAPGTVAFSGAVTSLKVKNNYAFPAGGGICLLTTPFGDHHIFSYGSKTDSAPGQHTLDDIQWLSKPMEDFDPRGGFDGTGTGIGDLIINYWASAPISITSSNNKINFNVTIAGVETVHEATLPIGSYDGDVMDFGAFIAKGLQAIKPLTAGYFAKYSESLQLWTIGTNSPEVEQFKLLFSTGASAGTSIRTELGFGSTDFVGAKSYLSTTNTQHKGARVFDFDKEQHGADSQRFIYGQTHLLYTDENIEDAVQRLGFSSARYLDATDVNAIFEYYPDEESVGGVFTFINQVEHGAIIASVNGEDQYIVAQPNHFTNNSTDGKRVKLHNVFLSWPKGTNRIIFTTEVNGVWTGGSGKDDVIFLGARQAFSKPAWETLTLDKAILKTFEIAPIRLYGTFYSNHDSGHYSPVGSNDNVDTITESGSWSSPIVGGALSKHRRQTSNNGDYVDIDFTLAGDGGGFAFSSMFASSFDKRSALFLATQATGIVEGTDQIVTEWTEFQSGNGMRDRKIPMVLGLKAGSYRVRWKKVGDVNLAYLGFYIYDTVRPEEGLVTNSDVTNAYQSPAFPHYKRAVHMDKFQNNLVKDFLHGSGYREMFLSNVERRFNEESGSYLSMSDDVQLREDPHHWYGTLLFHNGAQPNTYNKINHFFHSVMMFTGHHGSSATTVRPEIDGINHGSDHNVRIGPTKSIITLDTERQRDFPTPVKVFEQPAALSAGLVYSVGDTKGIRINQRALLIDNLGAEEEVIIVGKTADTDITISKALTVLTPANIVSVNFGGFKSFKCKNALAEAWEASAFMYEPLAVTPSNFRKRLTQTTKTETRTISFKGVVDGDDLYYPTHSDGEVGNWQSSSFSITKQDDIDTTYLINRDLQNIEISAGELDIKITSTREVPVLIDPIEGY